MTLKRLFAPIAILALAPAAPAFAAPAPAFNRDAWKADFERLKPALAQGYANLDWQVERRGFNLSRADGQIGAMLDKVDSDAGAALVFAKLVDAFHDPHLQLNPGPPPQSATQMPMQSSIEGPAAAKSACKAANYSDGRAATRLPYPSAPGWTPISDGPFQAGLIGDIGIIRIPTFGESRYLSACKTAQKPGMDSRALQLATRAELNRQLAALVGTLRGRGMKRLAIDLSRNGGGSEWSTEAVTLFTEGRLTRQEPRHVGPTCDRSGIWKGEKPACTAYAGAPTAEWVESDGAPAWSGPLAILADRDTASAAEEFITWLRDNKRAKMGGEKTFGAGCGYMDGGNAFAFKAANIHLMMPNCSRFTRDGTNEIEGQAPDIAIDWATVDARQMPAVLGSLFL
jgi:hypothetical protein